MVVVNLTTGPTPLRFSTTSDSHPPQSSNSVVVTVRGYIVFVGPMMKGMALKTVVIHDADDEVVGVEAVFLTTVA